MMMFRRNKSAPQPAKRSLRREIAITLLIKFALLVAVKFLFFNHPADKTQIAEHVSAVFSDTPVSSPSALPNTKEHP